MKNNYFFICLFVLLLTVSCKKNSIDLAKETVAVTAVLSNNNGIEVILSKALDPLKEYLVKDIPSTFFIKNANVALYEDGNLVETLSYENDKYVSKNANWKPTEGKKYTIMAQVIDYGTIESEDVVFPKAALIKNFDYTTYPYDNPSYNLYNDPILKIVAEVKNNSTQKEYYQIKYKYFSTKGDSSLIYFNQVPNSENKELNEKKASECGAIDDFFTNECLIDNKVYAYSLLYSYWGNPIEFKKLKRVIVSFDTVSESLHKYITNFYNRDQVDTRFEDMPASYTNIKNGIGIFYAVNEGKQVFVIKP